MLKLSKYELRKNRTALIFLLSGLGILQIVFMLCIHFEKEDYILSSAAFLALYALICYFAVFIFAITNYYREINSRTSYLVFMTPISPLRIVLSKMLTVLLLGIIFVVILAVLALLDIQLITVYYNEYTEMAEIINEVLSQFGINTAEILFNILFGILTFLLAFFSSITLVYLCVTLSATLLQNSRFKLLGSIVFFLLASFLRTKAEGNIETLFYNKFPLPNTEVISINMTDLLFYSLPYTGLNLILVILCVTITTWLLKKKLSL